VTGREEPFRAAVTTADWSDTRAPALAVKVAEVAPPVTITEAGTVSEAAALLESVTVVSLAGALDKVTVQVVLAFETRLADTH